MVKRFLQARSGGFGRGSRHGPEVAAEAPPFRGEGQGEGGRRRRSGPANPRARSARLRVATRTEAPAGPVDRVSLGLPKMLSVEGFETWRALFYITSLLAVLGLAIWAYQENYRTQASLREGRAAVRRRSPTCARP